MSNNEWLDIDVLEDYLDGKLDAKTMHKVERVSLEDPFVAQALAGLTESKKRKQSLSLLQKQLQERIAQKPVEKKLWIITSQRLSIAAVAAVLFVTVSLFFFMRENSRQKEEQIANNKPKKVDVTIAPETSAVAMKVDTTTGKTKVEVELDKAIANAKTNSYAKNNKIIKDKSSIVNSTLPVPVAEVAAPSPALKEVIIQENIEKERAAAFDAQKRAQQSKMVSGLAGKVAGVQLNTKPGKSINGLVIAEDGLPMPGVTVKNAGNNQVVSTNANGEFSLPFDSLTNQKLTFNALGYNTKEINVSNSEKIKVELEPSNNSLSEVVVSNARAKSSKTITTTSNPVIGWNDYNKYLQKNVDKSLLANLSTPSPIVELSFIINSSGQPTNIKIVKSGGKIYDNEAIRLLKNGSKWLYSPLAKNIGKIEVDFNTLIN